MARRTYQTKVPRSLVEFWEAIGILFGRVERHLYRDLQRLILEKDLKRQAQHRYGINASQLNAIHIWTERQSCRSLDECRQRQVKLLAAKISELEASLKKLEKHLQKTPSACHLKSRKLPPKKALRLRNHSKKQKVQRRLHELRRLGQVLHVNPADSSVMGLTEWMRCSGLSRDTGAALVLARRALRKSERIPVNCGRDLAVRKSRQVWNFWNALKKKLGDDLRRRHSFFDSRAANSGVEATEPDDSSLDGRGGRNSSDTSICRCDSDTQTARFTRSAYLGIPRFT